MSKIENKLYNLVAYDWIGTGQRDSPPLSHDTLKIPMNEYSLNENDVNVFSLLNDAHEIWFGYPDRWKFHISRKDFHKVIRWYLKRYIFGEWLGIRRKIYYKLLSRRVKRYKS